MSSSNRVFLVQPAAESALDSMQNVSRLYSLIPPLGVLSIAAYLEERGVEVEVFDFNALPDSMETFLAAVERHRPEWLGITCVTSNFNGGLRIARMAKDRQPFLKVVFGGPHVSALRERILADYPEVDAVVAGEGEAVFYKLINSGLTNGELNSGVVLRDASGQPRFTGYPREMLNLDSLPYPAYHKLKGFPENYQLPLFSYPRAPGVSIVSSRGCPYTCSYCDRSVFRRSFRFNSADYLFRHLNFLHNKYGIRHFTFYDDQFTFDRNRIMELCGKLVDSELNLTFSCAVRAEHVDSELLAAMRAAGCWGASIGIETGDSSLLARHRSNSDVGMLAEQVKKIRRAGIRVKGLLMLGLPGESEKSIRETRDFVFSLPICEISIAKFTPFPGAPLYEKASELGVFDEDWDRMDCLSFQFVPQGMSRKKMEHEFDMFYRAHFRRPKVWLYYLSMLWHSPDSWRRFICHGREFLLFAWRGSGR